MVNRCTPVGSSRKRRAVRRQAKPRRYFTVLHIATTVSPHGLRQGHPGKRVLGLVTINLAKVSKFFSSGHEPRHSRVGRRHGAETLVVPLQALSQYRFAGPLHPRPRGFAGKVLGNGERPDCGTMADSHMIARPGISNETRRSFGLSSKVQRKPSVLCHHVVSTSCKLWSRGV